MKNSLISSTTSTHFASFHSTSPSCQKGKSKWDADIKGGQQPTKNHIRYSIRERRADAKRALNELLFRSGSSKVPEKELMRRIHMGTGFDTKQEGHSFVPHKKGGSKSSAHRAGKIHSNKQRRNLRKKNISEDFDDDPEPTFQATYGNRAYTWTFKSWQGSFQNSTSGFEWREYSSWEESRAKRWETQSDTESDDDSCSVGSHSDRTTLGLPPRGPLKIEDVKNAFRLSALKWHPDKHQGDSQTMAEEKFKRCANAYRSLCSALSPA